MTGNLSDRGRQWQLSGFPRVPGSPSPRTLHLKFCIETHTLLKNICSSLVDGSPPCNQLYVHDWLLNASFGNAEAEGAKKKNYQQLQENTKLNLFRSAFLVRVNARSRLSVNLTTSCSVTGDSTWVFKNVAVLEVVAGTNTVINNS